MDYPLGKLIPGLTYEEYDAVGGVRASDLRHLMPPNTPAHYMAWKETPKKATDALEFGKVFHSAIENGDKFLDLYLVEPDVDKRTIKGREEMENFKQTIKPENIILKAKWADPMIGMVNSCRKHNLLRSMLKDSVRETSLFVIDDETGELLQCRPDFIASGREKKKFIVDIKSTRSAGERFFTNEIFRGYEDDRFYILQAAHYVHCMKLAGLQFEDSFTFVAIEKEPPYGINTFPMDMGCIAPGEQWRSMLTKFYAECKKKNEWPCYSEKPILVAPPEWVKVPEMEG